MASRSKRPAAPKISAKRAGRLHKMLTLLAKGPVGRGTLLRRLKIGMRTFYRDVDLLRDRGVQVLAGDKGYSLTGPLEKAAAVLPFPDPQLSFADVQTLMKGRTAAHRELRAKFEQATK